VNRKNELLTNLMIKKNDSTLRMKYNNENRMNGELKMGRLCK
jgi:hypothetical protein